MKKYKIIFILVIACSCVMPAMAQLGETAE